MKFILNKNEGNVLMMTLIITFIFIIFAGALMNMAIFSSRTNTNVYEREQARMVARSTVLSLKEYIINEGDKSFAYLSVPSGGGTANISESLVSINSQTGNLGEANNIRINAVDKNSSTWEVTVEATGYYPDISYSSSGVDASVTFDIPKSSDSSLDPVLEALNNNVLNALGGNITFMGDNIVAGGLYAGGDINISNSFYFPRAPGSDGNYIRAGGEINIFHGSQRFDVYGIEAAKGITINEQLSQANWSQEVHNLQSIGITAPVTNSFYRTEFITSGNFTQHSWDKQLFADRNATLKLLQGSNVVIMEPNFIDDVNKIKNLPATITEVKNVSDLNLRFPEPIEIIMKELPTGEDFPDHDISLDENIITDNVRLTQSNEWLSKDIIIDTVYGDIIVYVDGPVTIGGDAQIIIHDGRDHAGKTSHSVVFIIDGPDGKLTFRDSGRISLEGSNNEVPQLYFISNSPGEILEISNGASAKGFVIAPNSSVQISADWNKDIPRFHGSIIANEIDIISGNKLFMWAEPIESTMERVVSQYVSEVRGGSND